MSITPEARHAISEAIWLTWLIASAGVFVVLFWFLRGKWNNPSLAQSGAYKLWFRGILLLIVLGALGADKVLQMIPTRNPPPAPPDPAAVRASEGRLRLSRGRTLTRGEDVLILWDRRTAGVVAGTGQAAQEMFGPQAAPGGHPVSEDGGRAYTVASGTKALFMYYDSTFSDRNIACVLLEDGLHPRKLAWIPGDRLRRAAR